MLNESGSLDELGRTVPSMRRKGRPMVCDKQQWSTMVRTAGHTDKTSEAVFHLLWLWKTHRVPGLRRLFDQIVDGVAELPEK